MNLRHFFTIIISALSIQGFISCSSKQWYSSSGAVWGTSYHITYEADKDLTDSILFTMNEINESLSMFSPTSTVSKINSGESDYADEHFMAVYDISRKVNAASFGRFDPTVAPLVDLWGFGRNGRETTIPDSITIAATLERVGIHKSSISGHKIIKGHPLMEFDFSAIAKGYGVESVASMLRRNGCSDFMVEIGGEIQLKGLNPKGNLWRIQIDAPEIGSNPGDSALMVVELTDCGIATSGNYRNYRTLTGDSIIGHTIDPITGFPVAGDILSATVISSNCGLADALATAIMASPADSCRSILSHFPNTKAYIVLTSQKTLFIDSE